MARKSSSIPAAKARGPRPLATRDNSLFIPPPTAASHGGKTVGWNDAFLDHYQELSGQPVGGEAALLPGDSWDHHGRRRGDLDDVDHRRGAARDSVDHRQPRDGRADHLAGLAGNTGKGFGGAADAVG